MPLSRPLPSNLIYLPFLSISLAFFPLLAAFHTTQTELSLSSTAAYVSFSFPSPLNTFLVSFHHYSSTLIRPTLLSSSSLSYSVFFFTTSLIIPIPLSRYCLSSHNDAAPLSLSTSPIIQCLTPIIYLLFDSPRFSALVKSLTAAQ